MDKSIVLEICIAKEGRNSVRIRISYKYVGDNVNNVDVK